MFSVRLSEALAAFGPHLTHLTHLTLVATGVLVYKSHHEPSGLPVLTSQPKRHHGSIYRFLNSSLGRVERLVLHSNFLFGGLCFTGIKGLPMFAFNHLDFCVCFCPLLCWFLGNMSCLEAKTPKNANRATRNNYF